MQDQYVVTAERINAVIGYVASETKALASLDRIAVSRKEARAAIFADWKAQGVQPKHFKKAPKGDNEHLVVNAFLNDLAIYATPIGRGDGKQYLTPELVAEYKNEALGNGHLILGRQKGETAANPKATNWKAQIGKVLSDLGKGYVDYLKDLEAPAEKAEVKKTESTPEELVMKALQQLYGKTQKAAFKCHDADAFKKALHLAAFAFTGKEGQIKTGDATKK